MQPLLAIQFACVEAKRGVSSFDNKLKGITGRTCDLRGGTNRQRDGERYGEREKQRDKMTVRDTDRETHRETDKQRD